MSVRPRSLRARAALGAALGVAGILLVHGAYAVRSAWRDGAADAEGRALAFARGIRAGLGEEIPGAGTAGRLLVDEPAVDRIRIADASGALVLDTGEGPGAPAGDALLAAIGESPRPVALELSGRRWVVAGLPGRGGALAARIAVPTAWEVVQGEAAALILLGALCVALATALVAAHARGLLRPLERLAAETHALAEGRLSGELDAGPLPEVHAVAARVNQVAARLRENIAELEESNRRLAAANRSLTELDQTKSDLLANVSHELRTPLTAIKGYADYMLERKLGAITPNQERGLHVVQKNLDRLSRTIDALLDYSRLEAGQVAISRQGFSLGLLVDQVQQSLRSMAEKKRLALSVDVPADLSEVFADREKLGQVLENLIVNAIKFTPDGGSVSVSGRPAEAGGVEVCVSDTGIGIPAAQLTRIFDRFHQVDATSRRRFSGVGLGLAIVKGILDAHGAEVRVDSTPGAGTRVRFRLPAAQKAGAPTEPP